MGKSVEVKRNRIHIHRPTQGLLKELRVQNKCQLQIKIFLAEIIMMLETIKCSETIWSSPNSSVLIQCILGTVPECEGIPITDSGGFPGLGQTPDWSPSTPEVTVVTLRHHNSFLKAAPASSKPWRRPVPLGTACSSHLVLLWVTQSALPPPPPP